MPRTLEGMPAMLAILSVFPGVLVYPTWPERRVTFFFVSQFPPWDQVKRARTAGKPVNQRYIWNPLESLGGWSKRGVILAQTRNAGLEGRGFLEASGCGLRARRRLR